MFACSKFGKLKQVAGMTLIELLVVMAILVTVTTSTMMIFRGITRAWQAGELRAERYQQVRLLFDLFSREVATSVVNTRYPFIGINAGADSLIHKESVFDEMIFVGTLPGRMGLVERGYWINADGDLMCHDDEPADGDYASGISELCGRGVSQFDLSYFDGTVWTDRWDGSPNAEHAGRLPKAVRIKMTIGERKPEQFETVIYVPTS